MKTVSRRSALQAFLAVAFAARVSECVNAGNGCCVHCGCGANRCRKVCRLVCEDKKITTTCWGMQCEEICVPGPSTPDCKHCETVCPKGPNDQNICSQPKRLIWTSWIPGCNQEIVTKRKLMKKTVTTSVPSFKWVVEDACSHCIAAIEPVTVPEGTKLPPAPKVDGAEILMSRSSR